MVVTNGSMRCVVLAVLMCSACRSPASEPSASYSRELQRVGTPADGLTLRSIRTAAEGDRVRVVLELGGDVVPATEARLEAEPPAIVVELAGVRRDATGNRPLRSEAGEPFGEVVPVNAGPVKAYGRRLALDDSLVTYEIQLTRPAAFRLEALREPVRIVVEVPAR